MAPPATYTAAQVAARTGVPAATVRYYVRSGLLPRPRRGRGRTYSYTDRHLEGVRLIRALRARRRLPLALVGRILPQLLGRKDAFRAETWDELIRQHDARDSSLLDAAIRMFARHGYAGTTVEDIAAEAGRAKGSVYRAHPSKADLFFAAAARAAERCRTPRGTPSRDALRRYLPILLDLAAGAVRREPGFAAATARVLESAGGGPAADAIGGCLTRALRDHLRSGTRRDA